MAKSAFDFIAREAISGDTIARYRILGLAINGGTPFLDMRPATEENLDYHKAGIRLDVARQRRLEALERGQRKKRITDDEALSKAMADYEEGRKRDLDLFAQHVVVGWGIEYAGREAIERPWPGMAKGKNGADGDMVEGPMLDGDNKPVECVPETARDFLAAVMKRSANDWDLIRGWAKSEASFRAQLSSDDTDALAKNSATG